MAFACFVLWISRLAVHCESCCLKFLTPPAPKQNLIFVGAWWLHLRECRAHLAVSRLLPTTASFSGGYHLKTNLYLHLHPVKVSLSRRPNSSNPSVPLTGLIFRGVVAQTSMAIDACRSPNVQRVPSLSSRLTWAARCLFAPSRKLAPLQAF